MHLPPEIWLHIFAHCDVQSLVSLGQVSRVLSEIFRSDSLEKDVKQTVLSACPFMECTPFFSSSCESLNEWTCRALVLHQRMTKHTTSLTNVTRESLQSNEYSYLADLHGLGTTQYSPGMQKLLSADDSSFTRQMVLRKAKRSLERLLGAGENDEVKFYDNGVQVVAQKGARMLVVPWKSGKLDMDNVDVLALGEGEGETHITQLTSHTLVVKSDRAKHSYHLVQEHQLIHLFTLESPSPPPMFDYNGYLWTKVNNELLQVFTSFTEGTCHSFVTSTPPIALPEKPLSSSFCTFAETPFRHENAINRFLLLSENPYSTCDFFVDLETGKKYASRPLEALSKVYPVIDGQKLFFVKRAS